MVVSIYIVADRCKPRFLYEDAAHLHYQSLEKHNSKVAGMVDIILNHISQRDQHHLEVDWTGFH